MQTTCLRATLDTRATYHGPRMTTVIPPRVAVLLTGGTIDALGLDRLDLAWYLETNQRLSAEALLGRIPELQQLASITQIPFRRLPSHALVDADWLELARTIHGVFNR